MVDIEPFTDTDTSPFDTGAYASRQSYVSGQAVKKAALEVRSRILERAEKRFDIPSSELDIAEGNIVRIKDSSVLIPLGDLTLASYYEKESASPITSDISNRINANPFPSV